MGTMVELSAIAHEDKSVLRNLLNLYMYDFSEYTGADVNCHGSFEYRRIDQYWLDDACHPFYILVDGKIAGFVLVHRYGMLGQDRHVIAEFFVMRKFRRMGVGAQAARKAFEAFPGGWEVSQLADNGPSQRFWRHVIHDVTNGIYDETVIDGRPVQLFEIAVFRDGCEDR